MSRKWPRFKEEIYFFQILLPVSILNQILFISIIETNNNFNKDFIMLINSSSFQIEGKYNDFCNFSNDRAGNVIESIPNFEF